MDGKSIVIIPTYNEMENISVLIPDLMDRYPHLDILIVDDNSPDGTADYVRKMQENNGCIKLIERPKKMGLGTAYVAGFRYMLENGYDYAIQMDADYSHDPKEIGNFFREIRDNDLVIGSRYITGVNVVNWPMRRLLLSYFANYYTKFVTGIPVADSTGGFKIFRRSVLETINLKDIRSNGYSFQIEMNYKAWKAGFKIKEIPIIFIDRVKGRSKMNKKIVREAVFMVWKLRFKSILGRL
ncbi:MAG: polyprenol monophosphomannose synthase [Ignavibacteria bacterium]|jgi:dolichol-phosphate mannosyltransferase|nr:polyprenol monophosphomannose synthase [Ignavibacteria bacterium]MCU7503117.1 polyprenol monophosphomannose synthase [Ignavibacteria bacterium]MCU7518427.1 polyprenol monophosphomannose synthase [Ignavibacteria bacterium]